MKLRLTIHVPNWLDRIFAWPTLFYRQRKYGYPFRRIALTEGKSTIVDPDDYYWLNAFCWLTCGRDDNLYAARVVRAHTGRLKTILMHRQILLGLSAVEGNAPPALSGVEGADLFVDHRNGHSLDNRKSNLRPATPSQNSCNSRRDKSNTYSQYRGVSFSKRKQKWFAAIRANGKKLWLGYFTNETDAAHAYDTAAKQYHGEFAVLNFE